ncbi:MAG: hypothetical protein IKJ77_03770 [Firmicutes bacterium]|nr:hypothetical protein [Bacillota bacterium]
MGRQVMIDEESYKKFQAALMLTAEDESLVLSRLISEYAHNVFAGVVSGDNGTGAQQAQHAAVTEADESEQKKSFVNWFRGLTRNGKAYNPVTISGYAGRIENACKEAAFASVPISNLFGITDLTDFLDVQKQLKECAGYAEFDAKVHNGFTAALKKYEEFLRFQANGLSVLDMPMMPQPYFQTSTVHRWTMEEDLICCKRFLQVYVIEKSDMDTVSFLQSLAKEVPEVSEGSLRMKIQNIKHLTSLEGLENSSLITSLGPGSMQCKSALKQAMEELDLR